MGMSTSFFTGRGDILQRLDSIFCPRNTGGKPLRECLLYGMGGVGKTEIALKISEVLEDRFVHVAPADLGSV
jgi:Holliday junction resolvasome RuvABC ATP-dependent DNA helicase subunit